MLMTAEIIRPGQRQGFANVSLSENTIAEIFNEISTNVNSPLQEKVKSFLRGFFSCSS